MKRRFIALLFLCQLSTICFSQQTPSNSPTPAETPPPLPQQPARSSDEEVVRITTNLVQLDAVITDKNGKQITDLRPEEVEIFEDGKKQKITNLSYISLDSPEDSRAPAPSKADKTAPPIPPVKLRPEQIHRTIALVVDDLGLSFESTHYVRQALKKFLDQQMQPNDLVAIIRTGAGIGALQEFTSDKRQLYAAVERVKWNPTGRAGISAFAPIQSDPKANALSHVGDGDNAPAEDVDQFREEIFSVGTLGALNYVVRGLRELPGRKSVVLISDGIKIFNGSDPTRSVRILEKLRALTDLANRASVVIYTMDARGLQTLGLTAADATFGLSSDQIEQSLNDRRNDLFESQNGLNYIAQQTGGLAIRNTNDLAGGIKRVIEDQKGYYLIGYRPDESTFDQVSGRRKFHKLSLKVTREGKFNVRMRNGFYGVTDEEAKPGRRTLQQQLLGALTSPFGSSGVHLRLTSLFANDAKTGSFMRSFLHVKASDLTFTEQPDGWHRVNFDIFAVTFGDNGAVIDQISRSHTMQLKGKTYDRVLREGFTYNITVPIKKAGAYQLRTALLDSASERIGSASQFVEVPDLKKNRLTLSGLLMRGLSLEAYQKGARASSSSENSDDTEEGNGATGSVAVRQFPTGYVVVYGFGIYNAELDKETGKPKLQTQLRVFRDGQLVFTGNQIPVDINGQTDMKRVAVGSAIQLGTQMQPGEYVLQVIVTDLLAKEKYRVATQWSDFEITK